MLNETNLHKKIPARTRLCCVNSTKTTSILHESGYSHPNVVFNPLGSRCRNVLKVMVLTVAYR